MVDVKSKDGTLKNVKRMMTSMQIGFVVVLIVMFSVCGKLYYDHKVNVTQTSSVVNLSNQFSKVVEGFATIIKYSRYLKNHYSLNAIDPRVVGMDSAERAKFYETAKPEMKIKVGREQLHRHLLVLHKEVLMLDKKWQMVTPEVRDSFFQKLLFPNQEDPFGELKDTTQLSHLATVKAEAEAFQYVNGLIFKYDEILGPRLNRAQDHMKQFLANSIREKNERLSQFLSYILVGLGLLGFVIFLPVILVLRRLFTRLLQMTEATDKALKSAKAADKAKSEFLATMSHEIRTPMNGVLGMAELLSRTELDTRQKTFTDIIIKSGNALLTIINDILDFSKIEAAQLNLVKAPFNIVESIEDVGSLMSSNAAEKDIELIVGLDPKMPEFVLGDSGRLRQVLTNLIGNAVKFTEVGHVLVRTKCEFFDDKNGVPNVRIAFEIEDTGIGIPEDQIDKVFEKFSQVDGTTTRKHEGTGLGLAISARLVELMGGKMAVSSEFNKGSCFSFTIELPVDKEHEEAGQDQITLKGARILVIDDNPTNRAILVEHAQHWQHDCAAVESGPLGLQFLEHSVEKYNMPVDLVILDFHMPEMNGADVLREIRTTVSIKDTPVLILSSVDQAEELNQLSNFEIDGHLSKPARSKLLQETVNSILKKGLAKGVRAHLSEAETEVLETKAEISTPQPEVKTDPKPVETPRAPANLQEVANAVVSEPTAPTPEVQAAIPAPSTDDQHKLSVLVAEDNPVNQIVFSEALKQHNHDFEIASDGVEAVELWKKHSPKVVIMDISMPNMNGLEATAEIRRIEEEQGLEATPIIAVTAHAMKSDEQMCLDAGVSDYMTKPISPDMLNEKISHWLDVQLQKAV